MCSGRLFEHKRKLVLIVVNELDRAKNQTRLEPISVSVWALLGLLFAVT